MLVPVHWIDKATVTPAANLAAFQAANPRTPSNGFKGFYVGGAGNITLVLNGNSDTMTGVLAGAVYAVPFDWVDSATTTATGIVGLAAEI